MIRYIIFVALCICTGIVSAIDHHAKDSLLLQLKHTTVSAQRISIYRNLADICFETPDEKTYLLGMYREAKKAGDTPMMLDALNDLACGEAKEYRMDSAYHYMNLIKATHNVKEIIPLSAYLHMRFFDVLCSHNETEEAIAKELQFTEEKKSDAPSLYSKIVQAYITGSSLHSNEMMKEALPYLETAMNLSKQLPPEKRIKFVSMIVWKLSNIYSFLNECDSAIRLLEEDLENQQLYYKDHYEAKRPFYNLAARELQIYASLLTNAIMVAPEKMDYYWQQIVKLNKELTNPYDRYNYFLSMDNYYLNLKPHPNYEQALIANDSLIQIAQTIIPNNLPGLYDIQSQTYEAMGNFKEALAYLRISAQYKDSLNTENMQKQLSELQIKYEVNKLNNEKSQLEIKNKRILVICLFIILTIVIVICLYLYHNLKKEKKMKIHLRNLKQKAEESEKMKTAFINSICHEIRTPLNAIVGFSDLIFNDEVDKENRESFSHEVQKNTVLLTSLINNMLEVSSLDVSQEKLPCKQVDLHHICIQEMKQLSRYHKPDIEYHMDLPEHPVILSTHEKYLSLVIEHLLNNANKFTEKGTITLRYRMDEAHQQLHISVTDTGCGIPVDKHKEVFERFSKLNTFTPGNGLGLYLCQLIIRRLSGEINIDPTYKEGTKITVTIPVQ